MMSRRRFFLMLWSVLPALAMQQGGIAPAAHGQSAPRPPVTFRILALGPSVSGLFYELHGKAMPVIAGSSGFSAPYVAPPAGPVVFYRELPPEAPGGSPRRVAVAEARLPGDGPFLVFMLAGSGAAPALHTLAVDDSWTVHPARTMRLYNFSRRRALVRQGAAQAELASAGSRLFPYPSGTQAWLKVAVSENDEWVLRASGPQVTPPHTRSTVVLIDQEPSADRLVTHELLVRNFIDPEPPPAPGS